jgi:tRNA wybutosine-synthesizing protein 1
MLERLEREDALPTQIYLSMNAGSKETFFKVNCPLLKDSWERFLSSLEFIRKTRTRTLIRITLIKEVNDSEEEIPKFAELVKKANPNFVEVKSYMHVGSSTSRLKAENMLEQDEIKAWAEKLLKFLPNFEYMDEQEESRIVILQNKERFVDRWIIKPKNL